jgi:hypothetical protein
MLLLAQGVHSYSGILADGLLFKTISIDRLSRYLSSLYDVHRKGGDEALASVIIVGLEYHYLRAETFPWNLSVGCKTVLYSFHLQLIDDRITASWKSFRFVVCIDFIVLC